MAGDAFYQISEKTNMEDKWFDPRHLKSFPNHDAKATVVYASSEENIETTIVNGKIVYHKGTFAGGLSETELIREIDAEMVKGL